VIGLDLDPMALEIATDCLSTFGSRFRAIRGNFADLSTIELGNQALDGILVDLGVSSMQLDQAEKGFSFLREGPLDMRMNPDQPVSAREIVNNAPAEEIAHILWTFGEERMSRKIAHRIIDHRRQHPINTTTQLADLITSVYPRSKSRRQKRRSTHISSLHPATRTFQALRIFVNDELENLKRFLESGYQRLKKPGGRLCIISFHSLEDRLVKHAFRRLASRCLCPPDIPICICHHQPEIEILTQRPVTATTDEITKNPRARSAKLRAAIRI
jgi:16S rRNA (cytosine1402-N4)-methyltransferase